MIAVWHRFVTAVGTMLVAGVVATLVLAVCAGVGVADADPNRVFFDHIPFAGRMVRVAVVQVVHMPIVFDGRVAAIGTVFMAWLPPVEARGWLGRYREEITRTTCLP